MSKFDKSKVPIKLLLNLHHLDESLSDEGLLYEIVSYLASENRDETIFTISDIKRNIHRGTDVKGTVIPGINRLKEKGFIKQVSNDSPQFQKIQYKIIKHKWN